MIPSIAPAPPRDKTPPSPRPAPTRWPGVWRRLVANRPALVGLGVIVALLAVAIVADLIAPYPYWLQNLDAPNQPPTARHLLGTDHLGRDVLSRLIYGARVSIAVGLISQIIILLIGVPVGAMAGYFGGRVDQALMRLVDVMYAFPDVLLVIVVMTALRASTRDDDAPALLAALARVDDAVGGLLGVFLALGLTSWLTVARLVRGEVLRLKHREFVQAARVVGASPFRVLRVHILPNAMGPVVVAATLGIPNAILMEAALSFIGLGVQPPMPSWGLMLLDGYRALRAYPHLVLAPAAALSIAVLSYHFLGDGLRDALDPRLRAGASPRSR